MLILSPSRYLPSSLTTFDLQGNRIRNNETTDRTDAIKQGIGYALAGQCEFQQLAIDDNETVSHSQCAALLEDVHDARYIRFLIEHSQRLSGQEEVLKHPYVYPHSPPETFISQLSWYAAWPSAFASYHGASICAKANRPVYVLTRPPGHHAGHAWMGGFCYLNNAALAAKRIYQINQMPVGILDLDLHYGNGTADIVRRTSKNNSLFFASLHKDRLLTYPYHKESDHSSRIKLFDFATEPSIDEYQSAMESALKFLETAGCATVIVSIGFDACEGDPYGDWHFQPENYHQIGRLISKSVMTPIFVQEGGYQLDALSACAEHFVKGFMYG